MRILIVLTALLVPMVAFSFPNLVRHGYPNCTACHVSPSGGGMLNEYGRELSKEILSTWAFEGEQRLAYGAIPESEKFLLAGFFRGAQFHREDKNSKRGFPILMQADLEAAFFEKEFTLVGSIGRREAGIPGERRGTVWSRRHYAMLAKDQFFGRVGKFQRSFGVGDPDHRLYVRTLPGFIQDRETYNAELGFEGQMAALSINQTFDSFANSTVLDKEEATSLHGSLFLWEKQKIGMSVLRGNNNKVSSRFRRVVVGPWAIVSWTEHLYSQHEFVWQRQAFRAAGKPDKKGYALSQKLFYEIYQGINPFFGFETSQEDRTISTTRKTAYTLGADLFPRPHFNIQLAAQREVRKSAVGNPVSNLWAMLNFYL